MIVIAYGIGWQMGALCALFVWGRFGKYFVILPLTPPHLLLPPADSAINRTTRHFVITTAVIAVVATLLWGCACIACARIRVTTPVNFFSTREMGKLVGGGGGCLHQAVPRRVYCVLWSHKITRYYRHSTPPCHSLVVSGYMPRSITGQCLVFHYLTLTHPVSLLCHFISLHSRPQILR
jgi:hypothetical protein